MERHNHIKKEESVFFENRAEFLLGIFYTQNSRPGAEKIFQKSIDKLTRIVYNIDTKIREDIKMKLTNEERDVLLQASKILVKICLKTDDGYYYAKNNSGIYDNMELDSASDLCELLSRDSEIKFVTDFDFDSYK